MHISICWEKEKVNLNTWISTIEAMTERWLNLVLNFIELNLMVSAVTFRGDCFQCCFIKLCNGRNSNSVIVKMVNLRSIWDCLPICKYKGFQSAENIISTSHFCGLLSLFKQFLGILFNILHSLEMFKISFYSPKICFLLLRLDDDS